MIFIEDLMRGSLVDLLGTKVKVYSLGSNVVTKGIDDLNTYVVKPQSLMPILLTEDIFNNNFPDNDTGYVIYWMREEIGYHVELTTDLTQVIKHNVLYVHELQQILHICDMNIDIKL